MSLTEYAKTSDNYLAHRYFIKHIYMAVLSDDSLSINVKEVYLDLFEHFAISEKFVKSMIENYVDAGRLQYDDEKKTMIAITEKGLADIKRKQLR